MPSEPIKPTNAGIVIDETSGQRHIPSSVRADGSTRRPIKIRPGYRPPEDVELYKNRTAEGFRSRQAQGGVPGADGLRDDGNDADKEGGPAAGNKNAKRREARRRAKAAAEAGGGGGDDGAGAREQKKEEEARPESADPAVEREKKARNLRKKLKQAKELKDRKDGGQALLPEQIAKVIKINELVRELDALGFDANGDPRGAAAEEGAPA